MALVTKLLRAVFARTGRLLNHPIGMSAKSEDQYYEDLFVKDPMWNSHQPNVDEQSRWVCIESFLKKHFDSEGDKTILDVGCGRGWMTALLSNYGKVMGIEPVVPVVEHAKKLFPTLTFKPLKPSGMPPGVAYDLVASSEVIEHVQDKRSFLAELFRLVKPGGMLIITTPRGELYEEWSRKFGKPNQPIEEWIHTADLLGLLREIGFVILESTTAYEISIYQIHACRRPL